MHLFRFRPRFTMRRLMVVVAIVGLLMGGSLWIVRMRTRSAAYRQRAFEFSLMTARDGGVIFTEDGKFHSKYDNENDWLRDAWACKLAEKYWRLSLRPWLPVEPDPPPPELLAHPKNTVDDENEMYPCRGDSNLDIPWWTFLWTWRPQ